jgi:hypothetical protein
MAVGADHVAFGDLGKNIFPRSFAQPFTDAELLFAPVIELQDKRIALSAVDAWVFAKE